MDNRPILYIKTGCPWCDDALAYFSRHGVSLEIKDVRTDGAAMERMINVSGQTRTPTLEWDGFVVADFSVEELEAELEKNPAIRQKMGLCGK